MTSWWLSGYHLCQQKWRTPWGHGFESSLKTDCRANSSPTTMNSVATSTVLWCHASSHWFNKRQSASLGVSLQVTTTKPPWRHGGLVVITYVNSFEWKGMRKWRTWWWQKRHDWHGRTATLINHLSALHWISQRWMGRSNGMSCKSLRAIVV